jgi:outer membrane murein-binding lipoprotein Lpp
MDAPRRQFLLAATVLACSGLLFAGCDGGGEGGSLPLREIDATNQRVDALERRVAELEARVAGGTKGANPEASDAAGNNP